jgi:hypothetical protein
MNHPRRAFCTLATVLVIALTSGIAWSAQRDADKKASLSLKLTPPVGFSPLRVRVTADVRGGADDQQDFYCPSVAWDWGDGTVSESSEDCDPYQAGKSVIRRRFTAEHVYRQADAYQVTLRLKQKDKTIAAGSANVQVRGGVRDEFGS